MNNKQFGRLSLAAGGAYLGFGCFTLIASLALPVLLGAVALRYLGII